MNLPQPNQIQNLKIIEPEKFTIDNGIELFYLNTGSIEVTKLSLIFSAGNWFEEKAMVSNLVSQMLNEGTDSMKNKEINELFESNGVSFQTEQSEDRIEVSISGLSERIENSFSLLFELLTESCFPKKEFSTLVELNSQSIKNRDENVSSFGSLKFMEVLFGTKHPYGFYETTDNLRKLNQSDLQEFFNKFLTSKNVYIVLAGKFDKNLINKVNDIFGKNNWSKNYIKQNPKHDFKSITQTKINIDKKDSVQSAINIGNISINKLHEDYPKIRILNHILGGPSLSSRLMLNIRVEKGLTYGIYSEFKSFENEGIFRVKTELKKESVNLAIDEIYKEMERLKSELVSEAELYKVKNYMLGMFLQMIDGPFKLMDAFIAIKNYNQDYDYYDKILKALNNITAEEIRELANKYFDKNKFKEVVVG